MSTVIVILSKRNTVALRKESVDRNYIIKITRIAPRVALRKESVDRNFQVRTVTRGLLQSLSARRAWIEITAQTARNTSIAVALRKESVDRNNVSANYHIRVREVALRKESVDRNVNCNSNFKQKKHRRSPQGERG